MSHFATMFLQVEPSWFGPGLAAIVTALSIPIVSSVVTSALRYIVGAGINPRALVWIVAVAVTGFAYYEAMPALPDLDPANLPAYVSGLLLLGTGFAEFAKTIYDSILSKLPILSGPE